MFVTVSPFQQLRDSTKVSCDIMLLNTESDYIFFFSILCVKKSMNPIENRVEWKMQKKKNENNNNRRKRRRKKMIALKCSMFMIVYPSPNAQTCWQHIQHSYIVYQSQTYLFNMQRTLTEYRIKVTNECIKDRDKENPFDYSIFCRLCLFPANSTPRIGGLHRAASVKQWTT